MLQARMIGVAWSREHYIGTTTVRNNDCLRKGEKASLVLPCRTRLTPWSAPCCGACFEKAVNCPWQRIPWGSKRPQRALADKRANVANLTRGANLNSSCQYILCMYWLLMLLRQTWGTRDGKNCRSCGLQHLPSSDWTLSHFRGFDPEKARAKGIQ